MLKITIPSAELFNSDTNEFFYIKEETLLLEHSLLSISKWESKWKKPFISQTEQKSIEETIDYVRCMTITKGVDPLIYKNIPNSEIEKVNDYINDPMTATTFNDPNNNGPMREVITSEIIYYWMVTYNIPFECEKWHINRLLTLIKVCSVKNSGSKKMTQRQIMENNRALNDARRRSLHTKG